MESRSASDCLERWLRDRLEDAHFAWFTEKVQAGHAGDFRPLALGFSMASRRLGKQDLKLNEQEMSQAQAVLPGWNPSFWTVDQAARVRLAISLWNGDSSSFVSQLDRLFAAGDVGELVALYQGLPLYPDPPAHRLRAAEGIRTNMRAVFEAVALRNPYPAEQLDNGRWNQMVLKCLFIGSTLDFVVGLDRRSNPELARMLWEYARERRAAGRTISPELWRGIGPCMPDSIADEILDELAQRIKSSGAAERQGAALALASCPHPRAQSILADDSAAQEAVTQGKWNWTSVARAWAAVQG
jgi:hypothetical protein